MSDIWVTSDTHFGHRNIIGYCQRPFYDTFEMDEILIKNWNAVVKPQDKVYHLGDVYIGSQQNGLRCLERLNGHKRLILGNHDDGKDSVLHRNFEKILVWRMFPEFGLLLTHVPVHESALFKCKKNIHGHIHEKEGPSSAHFNVSVERTNYTPVNIEELRIK